MTGRGGVPTGGVSAVVLNVTATGGDTGGFVTAYPNGSTRPTASNLNYVGGASVANLVVAKLGPDGRGVNLFNGSPGRIDLVADLAGWFVDGAASDAGALTSLVPSRILDTRADVPTGTSGPVAAQATQSLRVLGVGGVPSSGVSAVVLNVTVTETTAPGYVTAYPGGTARPTASNLNYSRGQTVPNLVVVKVGADGTVSFFNGSSRSAQLVADVAGYVRDATVVPPSAVTGVSATTTPTSVTLTWTNPTEATYAGVMIRRTLGGTHRPTPPTGSSSPTSRPPGRRTPTSRCCPVSPTRTRSSRTTRPRPTRPGTTVTATTGRPRRPAPWRASSATRPGPTTHSRASSSPWPPEHRLVGHRPDRLGRLLQRRRARPGSDYTVCLTGSAVTGGSTDTYGYARPATSGRAAATGPSSSPPARPPPWTRRLSAAGGVDGTVTTRRRSRRSPAPRCGSARPARPHQRGRATTGSDGRYRLTGLLPGASLVVCFTAAATATSASTATRARSAPRRSR